VRKGARWQRLPDKWAQYLPTVTGGDIHNEELTGRYRHAESLVELQVAAFIKPFMWGRRAVDLLAQGAYESPMFRILIAFFLG
jgi:hypothetical protein